MSSFTSSPARFGLDVKVDEEKAGKECSEKDGEVGTELNLKGEGVCWELVNNGVKSKGRGGNSGREDSGGGGLDVEGCMTRERTRRICEFIWIRKLSLIVSLVAGGLLRRDS